jgi:hypothetical protein
MDLQALHKKYEEDRKEAVRNNRGDAVLKALRKTYEDAQVAILRKNFEDALKAAEEAKKAAFGVLICLPAWKQSFTEWAEDVLCERDADASTLELCFDADDGDVMCTFTEEEKRFKKNLSFRFSSPTTEGVIFGVMWAHSETNLLDGKFFIWQHTDGCCRYSCENYKCPINTQ